MDIDAGDAFVRRIAPLARGTMVPGAGGDVGGFGGVFDLAKAGFGAGSPRLVAGTDGVGSKLKLAFLTGMHDTVGIDCVAMCVNDIITTGAKPLFFLDYLATGRLNEEQSAAVVAGIAAGCKQAGCWLMGGETAEMPGFYADGEYDMAGFCVGALGDGEEILPERCSAGDVVIGVASSGIHSNGYSLVRKVLLEDAGLSVDDCLPGDRLSLGERLLVPTRIYVEALVAVREAGVLPHALAHITGGGLWENPQRSIPDELAVVFDLEALRGMRPEIFTTISQLGGVPESEMYRVFNMGVGLTVTVSGDEAAATLSALRGAGYAAEVVGSLAARGESSVLIDGVSDAPLG